MSYWQFLKKYWKPTLLGLCIGQIIVLLENFLLGNRTTLQTGINLVVAILLAGFIITMGMWLFIRN